MKKTYEMDLAGKKLVAEIGQLAEFASGAVTVKYGDTTVLVTATASERPRDGIDFFPLSVDYEERFYAVGKIPGGFNKREARPSEKAILASRLIDRGMRPLFPEDYRNDVSVVATVMSVDQDYSPEIAAMMGASIAVSISDIPFKGPIGSTNIGLVDGQLVINADAAQRAKSDMLLTVSSTQHKVMMIEAGANEVPEDTMFNAIKLAHDTNVAICAFIQGIVDDIGKPKHSYTEQSVPAPFYNKLKETIGVSAMQTAVFQDDKAKRSAAMSVIKDETATTFATLGEDELATLGVSADELSTQIGRAIYKFEKEVVRTSILREGKRPDSRAMDQMRKLTAEVDVVPRVHGSALFERGQTQVLTITTLGSMGEVQRVDGLDLSEDSKRYMHHYNFPSYSVGETRPSRGPGRREIGHGALAEKALLPVLPSEEDFPYAIRTVSEVLASNGSTSQGSVCASTLSLMAAGVPIKAPVAGISVGLVTDDSSDDFVLLLDIQGIEDFFGDMDFKVAGTEKGITAIQLDMKLEGISHDVILGSLEETKKARLHILREVMLPAIPAPRPEISPYAPKIAMITIDVEKMAEVIGPRGKVIKGIIEESGVSKIDTEDDGRIFVSDTNIDNVNRAIEIIKGIVMVPEVGAIFNGRVTRILAFGAFVEIAPGKEGLVHISELDKKRVEKVEDILNIGDVLDVKVIKVGEKGIDLSRKALL